MIVAAYGGPRAKLAELTVARDVPAGSYAIPVTGALGSIKPPLCHIVKSERNQQIVAEGKWAYYGALIDAVDAAGGTITLAAKTSVALSAATKLTVNQLRYASVATAGEDDPSLAAYVRYAHFLADEIAARGLKGTIEIWNEPPWSHDPWDHRGAFYDNAPEGINKVSPNWGMLRALLKDTPPAGVRYTWGGSHKSGSRGVLFMPDPAPARERIAASVSSEGWHPYGPAPEWNGWSPQALPGASNVFAAGLEGSNASSNFKQGRRRAYEHLQKFGWTVPEQVSEAGIATSDQMAKARWAVRFFLANMAMGPEPLLERVNFYRLAEQPDGYAMID